MPSSRRSRRRSRREGSLQDTYSPNSVCFGCGPRNPHGLRLKSRLEGEVVVADWTPRGHHSAFAGFVNGGIISVLMDCNGNWAAACALMQERGLDEPPGTVTARYTVTFLRPTRLGAPLRVSAWAEKIEGSRVSVKGNLEADGETTATMEGLFVAVREGHPAFRRWS